MKERVEKARAMIAVRMPLYTKLLFNTPFIEDKSIKTLCTDGTSVWYNPDFLAHRTDTDIMFMFLHELGHKFLGHPYRILPTMHNDTAQVAADYAVNMLLVEMGLKPPHDAYVSYKYIGMSFEEVYDLIYANRPPSFDDSNHGVVEEAPELSDQEDEEGSGDSPSGVGGEETEDNKPSKNEDQLQGSQKEKKREEAIEKQKQEMREAIQSAKIMGALSPDMERYFEKLIKSDTNWKDIIGEYVVKSTDREDYTFSRPNRRYEGDFILPGLFSERAPAMALGGDASGSVTKDELKDMSQDIVALMEEVRPEKLTVFWFDSRVQRTQVFEEGEEADLKPVGGGGTNYRPVFAEIEKTDLDIDLLIMLTDGYCDSFPKEAPEYPVLWVVWQDRHEFKPPFGDVVIMLRKKKKKR